MMIKDAIRSRVGLAAGPRPDRRGLALAAQEPSPAPRLPAPPSPAAAGPTEQADLPRGPVLQPCDGPAWREAFADEVPARQRPAAVHASGPSTGTVLDEFLEYCQSRPDCNIIQAPKVTTFDGASAGSRM